MSRKLAVASSCWEQAHVSLSTGIQAEEASEWRQAVLAQGGGGYPAHHMVLETTSRNQGSELSGAAMIPQMTVVADLTRSGGDQEQEMVKST